MTKNVCVIGGSGFIGSRLVGRLTKNPSLAVQIIDKKPSSFFPDLVSFGDVRSLDDLMGVHQGAAIVNLAAEHRDDVRPLSLYEEVNVSGARNICEVARRRGVERIVFTSSVAVYGFAPVGTAETGAINPFNEYGRTKYEAELVFRAWQAEAPSKRSLAIIRPTVVFGERNRGNVYNLLRQIASGRFVMIGHGRNRKSMAYVENVAAFVEKSLSFDAGVHVYNYIDKPDYSMNELVSKVDKLLGRKRGFSPRLPYVVGYGLAKIFDGVSLVTGRRFAVSAVRVKKFCSDSVYNSAVSASGFWAPVSLEEALEATVRHEFVENNEDLPVFYSE